MTISYSDYIFIYLYHIIRIYISWIIVILGSLRLTPRHLTSIPSHYFHKILILTFQKFLSKPRSEQTPT